MAYFNIRVYGILLDQQNRLLVSDEFIRGNYYTKLPGGGMEIGEGTRDCLQREFMEETGLNIVVGEHFYTTDFHQISAFNNKDQIVSIYYRVYANNITGLITSDIPFNFTTKQTADPTKEAEVFRWVSWQELTSESVSLPIDKVVIELLKRNT
ncbi:MAG: NUDIX domain-containing protein [Sphingobacteriia bacterium]|nr:MAG: NUDIX domain-containing protein [Sphingobacteriia bacterium]